MGLALLRGELAEPRNNQQPLDDVTTKHGGAALSTARREKDLLWTVLDLLGG